jgi:hypothetical protein
MIGKIEYSELKSKSGAFTNVKKTKGSIFLGDLTDGVMGQANYCIVASKHAAEQFHKGLTDLIGKGLA